MSMRLCAAAAVAMSIVACAAAVEQKAPTTAAPASPRAAGPIQPSTPQDEQIATLARQIDQDRIALNLPPPTPGAYSSAVPMTDTHAPTAPTEPTCRPASDTCTQACTLSGSICDNAKHICDIANELPGDAWAANKCVEGNETCAAAKKRCCDCAP